jgi:2-polyprenyl-3-methyl-5-hydroxy-6-metoxy-1,4-benzoquinol methylase
MRITPDTVKAENIKVYASEARTYDLLHPELWNAFEQKRMHRLVGMTLSLLPQRTEPVHVVDVGAGTGNLALKYLAHGCHVTAIDISQEMLEILEQKLGPEWRERCKIICSDVESALTQIRTLDGVCFSSVLHHLYDYEAVIREFVAKMRPGGFFFNTHDPLVQKPRSEFIFKLHRIIGRLDEALYRWNARRMGYRLEEFPDDSIAEYHQSGKTMDFKALEAYLKVIGMKVEHFETFTSRRFALFAWLSTEVIRSENSFTYIACKTGG